MKEKNDLLIAGVGGGSGGGAGEAYHMIRRFYHAAPLWMLKLRVVKFLAMGRSGQVRIQAEL